MPDSLRGNYAPTARKGQIITGFTGGNQFTNGFFGKLMGGHLNERVDNKNHFLISDARKVLDDYMNNVADYVSLNNVRYALQELFNTKIPSAGGHTGSYFADTFVNGWGSGKNVNGMKEFMLKIVTSQPLGKGGHRIIKAIGGLSQAGVLGFNVSPFLKQRITDFSFFMDDRVTVKMFVKSLFSGILNIPKWREISNRIINNEGYFAQRWNFGDYVKSVGNGELPTNKIIRTITKIALFGMEKMDKLGILTTGERLAREIVNEAVRLGKYDFKINSPEYWKKVDNVLYTLVQDHVSNSIPTKISRARSGDMNEIVRELSRFTADVQLTFEKMRKAIIGNLNSRKRAKAFRKASEDKSYTDEQREKFKDMAEKEERFNKQNGRRVTKLIASLLMMSMVALGIEEFTKRLKGKKAWNEGIDPLESLEFITIESTAAKIPFVNVIANAIQNNSDIQVFTVERMNRIINSMQLIVEACQTGNPDTVRKAIKSFVFNGLELVGVPANNVYTLIAGAIGLVDKDSEINMRSFVEGWSPNYMKNKYSEAIKTAMMLWQKQH